MQFEKLKLFIGKEFLLIFFFLLTILLAILFPSKIKDYPYFIDWNTIFILTGLLVITTAIKESGYLEKAAGKILKKLTNEREVAFFLVGLSIILSAFFTNDITLFILIPLTFGIGKILKKDITKLVIFEAIGVNVGSLLTPIGNPQNIFIWHKWKISFISFISQMLPLEIFLLIILFLFLLIVFPARRISFQKVESRNKGNKNLFYFSLFLLFFYITSMDFKFYRIALCLILLFYLIFYTSILFHSDWLLILLFIFIFIDFSIIGNMEFIVRIMKSYNIKSASKVYWFSSILSQIISNVPASVFIAKFSIKWKAISYGVNIGGNGIFIGSMANVIALRLVGGKNIFIDFHKYSIPFFLISSIVAYYIFFT